MGLAAAQDGLVSKSDFARLSNVSAARVTQWISEGKLTGAALVGDGRGSRICVEQAQRQLKLRLDPSQRFGNGLGTQLESAALAGNDHTSAATPPADPFEAAYRNERLRDLQFKNRKSAEEEMARRGLYTRTEDVQAGMAKLASEMMATIEGGLADLASAMSGKFSLPQREVLHELRTAFAGVRAKAADTARRSAAALPPLIQEELPNTDD